MEERKLAPLQFISATKLHPHRPPVECWKQYRFMWSWLFNDLGCIYYTGKKKLCLNPGSMSGPSRYTHWLTTPQANKRVLKFAVRFWLSRAQSMHCQHPIENATSKHFCPSSVAVMSTFINPGPTWKQSCKRVLARFQNLASSMMHCPLRRKTEKWCNCPFAWPFSRSEYCFDLRFSYLFTLQLVP